MSSSFLGIPCSVYNICVAEVAEGCSVVPAGYPLYTVYPRPDGGCPLVPWVSSVYNICVSEVAEGCSVVPAGYPLYTVYPRPDGGCPLVPWVSPVQYICVSEVVEGCPVVPWAWVSGTICYIPYIRGLTEDVL